jgi:hypothetical protein
MSDIMSQEVENLGPLTWGVFTWGVFISGFSKKICEVWGSNMLTKKGHI